MPIFQVTVYRDWREWGTLVESADSEEEAREIVGEYLKTDDGNIKWDGDAMDPQDDGIESIEEVG